MRTSIRALSPALALLLVGTSLTLLIPPYAASALPPGGGTPVKANESVSPRIDGFILSGAVMPSTPAGSPVAVRVTVENQGTAQGALVLEHAAPIPFDVKVTTKDGAAVLLTRYGTKVFARMAMPGLSDCRMPKVKPGEPVELSVPNLALYYDLTLPGEYLVVVGKHVGVGRWPFKWVALTTPPVPFTITDP